MYRRGRDRRYRDDDYIVEEVYVEEDPYYYDERPNSWITSLIGVITVVAILAVIGTLFLRSPRRQRGHRAGPSATSEQPELVSVPIGKPKIDLKAVENALWQTKADNDKDFQGWMKKFEDEVNAIYFATLRRENPKADPATLMKKPVRVAPERTNNLLHLYGYIDENNKKGYQNGEDKLLFVFQQTKPYDGNEKKLHYSLRDSSGYYYRQPGYYHSYLGTAMFLNFFVYPTIWYGLWWRPMFSWWGTPYWNRGFFYNRYSYYYRRYPTYRRTYRRTYYNRHRPWGWGRGSYYKRNRSGQYYSRTSRYNRYRSRGGSGSNRYRSRGTTGNRYRSRGTTGNRYRSRGTTGTNRYRSRGTTGNRYRSRGSRNRYRSKSYRYRSRRSWGRRSRYRSRRRSYRSFGRRRR